ncbi:DUF4365 domain-containing protein [Pseudosulfitobacter koreensis]|uniref:DUF4365 domain-containing protein n=1 Tax=Pseudosulfitobacter koreensis TaxID=2968472 RepID=A0ABT1Z4R4_9RHOB|nr:DUF4365 domain-containing protein [Pseudosulfitobacter koreense]MCR8828098.1 DUF4365 domain-containing protein [Pseudosulfitobacter koreense]
MPTNPKYTKADQTGEMGVWTVSRIVSFHFGWVFRKNHSEHDFGIDGYLDVVTDEGDVTGQQIAVQIKYGESYLSDENPLGFTFRGEGKHLNYYKNHPMPVLIIIGSPDRENCYWEVFDSEKIVARGGSWTLNIPKRNVLQNDKVKLLKLLPDIETITEEAKHFWKVTTAMQDGGIGIAAISEDEVRRKDTSFLHDFIGKILQQKTTTRNFQSKIEIMFDGVEDSQTEIFEIDEYRDYIKLMFDELPQISFFLTKETKFGLLGIIPQCFAFQEKVTKDYGKGDRVYVRIDPEAIIPMLEIIFHGLNLVTNYLEFSKEEQKLIDDQLMASLNLPIPNKK